MIGLRGQVLSRKEVPSPGDFTQRGAGLSSLSSPPCGNAPRAYQGNVERHPIPPCERKG
jgi:hypothetical protein